MEYDADRLDAVAIALCYPSLTVKLSRAPRKAQNCVEKVLGNVVASFIRVFGSGEEYDIDLNEVTCV